ncbi:MAG: AMP-binding protein, partial [Burkholderiales bacterium]|nr:AMP-binding protein [Burkholderiales bacterium]
ELLAMANQPQEPGADISDFLEACSGTAQPHAVAIHPDDIALMTYTSGTTGLPKGAMLSYRNASYKTAVAAAACRGSKDDVLLAVAPLYHIAGMVMGMNIAIHTGASCVLLYRFDPVTVLQAISRYHVSWWYSIAPMNAAIMQLPVARDYDLSSLRFNPVTSFGIQLTETMAQQWQTLAPNCLVCEAAYGLSETHTVDTVMPLDAIRWGTHGKPVPGNEIRIVDPDSGEECATGVSGEIILRSAGVFHGYRNKPEATAQTLRDGWVYTGDIGKLDADGYLTFLGRFKEMIKVSGYSVFPEEVESILIRHPAIAQAAVIGLPDPEKGEIIKACIVLKPGYRAAPEEIRLWSREHMANYKVPKQVEILDALPSTGAGKVLRRLLK